VEGSMGEEGPVPGKVQRVTKVQWLLLQAGAGVAHALRVHILAFENI